MSWFPDKSVRDVFWKCQIRMVHTILKCFTHFTAQNKTWIVILFSTKQRQKLQLCNGNFTAKNKWISAFTLLVYLHHIST